MRAKVNLTIDADVLKDAKASGINMSRVAEEALRMAAKVERNRKWAEENKDALEAYGREIREHGLALEKYRTF